MLNRPILNKEEIKAKLESDFANIKDWGGESLVFAYYVEASDEDKEKYQDEDLYELKTAIAEPEDDNTLEDLKESIIDYAMELEESILAVFCWQDKIGMLIDYKPSEDIGSYREKITEYLKEKTREFTEETETELQC